MVEYAELELLLRRQDGKFVLIKGVFHILPSLSCKILVASYTLIKAS